MWKWLGQTSLPIFLTTWFVECPSALRNVSKLREVTLASDMVFFVLIINLYGFVSKCTNIHLTCFIQDVVNFPISFHSNFLFYTIEVRHFIYLQNLFHLKSILHAQLAERKMAWKCFSLGQLCNWTDTSQSMYEIMFFLFHYPFVASLRERDLCLWNICCIFQLPFKKVSSDWCALYLNK